MALIACRECGNEVSRSAKTCPQCGVKKPAKGVKQPRKKTGWLTWLFLGVVAVGFIASQSEEYDKGNSTEALAAAKEKTAEQEKPKTPEELRKEKIDRQFSVWDGSHRPTERIINEALNDPESYDHDKTYRIILDDRVQVRTTFRAKNAFGAMMKHSIVAQFTDDGTLIEVTEFK